MENRISATLTTEDLNAILAAIQTIKEKMPFLRAVASDELKYLPKMGDQSRTFVAKALEVATHNQDFLPRSFDVEEMKKDVELYEALRPVRLALGQLVETLDGTSALAGSEAYAAALSVYQYAKTSGKDLGLEAALDDLGKRFSRKAKLNGGEAATAAKG